MYNIKENNMIQKLTNDRIAEIARSWGIPPAALLAVELVESGVRSGFLDSGRPQILFEGHVFYQQLKKYRSDLNVSQICVNHPSVCYSKWDKKKYRGGEKEWVRLYEARKIDEDCANKSASWGMFQVMGFNYASCNCTSIKEFIEKMETSGEQQLLLTLYFLKNRDMIKYLVNRQWANFAKAYNGSGYTANAYDSKLRTAYNTYVKKYPQ